MCVAFSAGWRESVAAMWRLSWAHDIDGGLRPRGSHRRRRDHVCTLRLTALRRSRAGTADASGGGDEVTDLGGGALVRVQSLCPRAELAHLG